MGDSNKGAVTYTSPFWRDEELAGALYSNSGPFVQMYDQSGHDDDNHAALVIIKDNLSQSRYTACSLGWFHEWRSGRHVN